MDQAVAVQVQLIVVPMEPMVRRKLIPPLRSEEIAAAVVGALLPVVGAPTGYPQTLLGNEQGVVVVVANTTTLIVKAQVAVAVEEVVEMRQTPEVLEIPVAQQTQ